MVRDSDTGSQKAVEQEPKELHGGLEKTDPKIKDDKKLVVDDGAFISNLGWISILSVTIAGLTMGGFGMGL